MQELQRCPTQRTSVRHCLCSAESTLVLVVVSRPRVFSTSRSNIFGRHLLGGWSAEGSERYNILAKFKIAQVQRSVIKIIWDKDSLDPLSESSLLRELTDSWRAHQTDKSEITRSVRLLSSRRYSEAVRPLSTELLPVDTQLEEYLEIDEDLAEGSRGGETRQAKATSLENGKDEKARRESDGLSRRVAGFSSTRFLHFLIIQERDPDRTLGECCMIPGLDHVQYEYAGSSMPNQESFDLTCKWCSKSVGFDASSGADSSSSTEEAAE